VNTYGTGRIPDTELDKILLKEIDLTPRGIIKRLDLLRPIYRKTAAYGHFGRRDKDFSWEKLDLVDTLLRAIK
jgi:S-adenosylmethionine synthetase